MLGEVLMVDNTLGGVGIAPSATGRVVSQHRPGGSYNTPDAILDAAANMVFGDVLLLEAQEFDPVGGLYYWPVEIADATYEAIRLATALGIIVVEAACNGGYDLDAYVNGSGQQIFNRGAAGFRDSGAIVVGGSTAAAPHMPVGFNFGTRLDCYAWGQSIDTTSTNAAGDDNSAYTGFFGGTSGASPIVVGAALIIQGVAQASLGYRFSPAVMRRLLTANGTPSANPAADRMGVMPDLHAIITGDLINLAPDLYLRDQVGDDGDPTSGFVSQSPDIIVRTASVADPQAAFGEGSGTENDAALSDAVQAGSDHFVYVRALNRGGADAVNASVDVYWSPPSTLVTPNLWNPIGSTTIASVPIANELTVSDEITWDSADIPGPGHYCFVAVAGNALDPKPNAATFATFGQFVTYIENNNNVAWRNFDVVPAPPSAGAQQMRFLIPGAFDTSRRFDLESIGRLPRGSRVTLAVPGWLAEALHPLPVEVKYDPKTQMAHIPLQPSGRHRLGTALLHARSAAKCVLHVHLPEQKPCGHHDFAIRQIYQEEGSRPPDMALRRQGLRQTLRGQGQGLIRRATESGRGWKPRPSSGFVVLSAPRDSTHDRPCSQRKWLPGPSRSAGARHFSRSPSSAWAACSPG